MTIMNDGTYLYFCRDCSQFFRRHVKLTLAERKNMKGGARCSDCFLGVA